ncbi:Metallo-dependent phosphatase-like protein [Xylaria bambusicola]|uniref:Metallo-dependent phosphatase-like protein n=1 Tax=Xylaria bambusicola TaxID=326684 RepID=UPI0020078467|nr:Metallo-dependent phosphatase-like protein [Xylaria bambusicola]KAI0525627.1 Metallo-dependent phosphatase-like protein [Xylaria bambusicola]
MTDSNAQRQCPSRRTRRTRFVCISDTHNCTVKLPKGDVLIHCGDLTNQGSFNELTKQVRWLEQADFECKIVVAGNHDLTLDTEFYREYGPSRHGNITQVPEDCQSLLTQSETLTYLLHESRTIRLTSPSGPQTTFSVFGSPYSPAWGGAWAFQYPRHDEDNIAAKSLWEQIPLDTDILITHGPAHTHCDESRMREAAGCEILRQQLWRVRPRLALCGHIHEARGVERVTWDLEDKNAQYAELGRTRWQDPNPDSEKNALVNLTVKGGMPLNNDGSLCRLTDGSHKDWRDKHRGDPDDLAYPGIGTLGLGEKPDSERSDQVALDGRLGRKETCIVNCAIQHSSYPHSGRGPRKLNKAIVIDLDLPVWEDPEPYAKA